nr:hypothetical protein GCM10025730_13990 [Promicromonospora thailandica]
MDLTDLSGLPRLPEQMSDAVSRFASYLDAQRGHSAHTRRAYVADVTDLLRYAMRHGTTRLHAIDLTLLRGWLASQSDRGLARSTLARRGASARAFLRWAHRAGLVPVDPSSRLASPKVPRTLPTVLDVDAASRLLDGARAAADEADEATRPAALRSWVAAELLYGAGIRWASSCRSTSGTSTPATGWSGCSARAARSGWCPSASRRRAPSRPGCPTGAPPS